MISLEVSGKEYKIEFGFNCFCDTDLMEKTANLLEIFSENGTETDDDVKAIGKIKELFCCLRELIYVGLEEHNPVGSIKDVGKLLDTYRKEKKDGEDRSIMTIFTKVAEELLNEGFLADILTDASSQKQ